MAEGFFKSSGNLFWPAISNLLVNRAKWKFPFRERLAPADLRHTNVCPEMNTYCR
jgi:hypothetical protein